MPNASVENHVALEIEQQGSQAIVHCRGRMVAEAGNHLYSRVRELIPVNNSIVLDLSGLTFVDSVGIGSLVRLYVSCRSGGVRMQVANVGPEVAEILRITNLFPVFTHIS